ncbi:MAG: shufflon system plasmid conjugative transfer pilus tip adhesin PilV [Rhodospirillales bacterium]|nr:shufflon system plasmid conjugative transfer pilus tip adhesin PilV [Alphaproteobacteria bacterium]MCB9986585.1 shufflon system plasmid conjugative transfer pilus tip adhesin PilV [Rhodospirillales bacterium]USO06885.1 MAG: shufflon system plasmid conjugative transfer pilus tip adhesin PilV [Rhodospirillales bacterium]
MTTLRARDAGFTLLELLLAVSLIGLLLTGMYQLFDSWLQRSIDRSAALDMLRVQTAAEDYVRAHFDTIKDDGTTTFVEIGLTTLRTEQYLPTGFTGVNALHQPIRVFYRNQSVFKVDPATGADYTDVDGNKIRMPSVEVVTVSDGALKVANQRLLDIARAGGPRMGVSTDMVMPGATFAGRITSVLNQWYVNRTDIAGLSAPSASAGYIAAYGRVNNEDRDPNDRWLYRVAVDDRPELNRMLTNIHMNDNELQNVGTMVADRVSVTGSAAFRGATDGTTGASAQAMTVEQALRVDGPDENRFDMKEGDGTGCTWGGGANRTLSGSGCAITGGELQVVGEAGDANLHLTNSLLADGSVITDKSTINMTTSNGISTFDTVNGNTMQASHSVTAPLTQIHGASVNTQELQSGTFSIAHGATIENGLVAAQIDGAGSHYYAAKQMDVGNAAEFTGSLYADGATASSTLYIQNISGGYQDAVLNRHVTCTQANGAVYCEPIGTTNWPGGVYREDCSYIPNGYRCLHYKYGVYFGHCDFTRGRESDGRASWSSACYPT